MLKLILVAITFFTFDASCEENQIVIGVKSVGNVLEMTSDDMRTFIKGTLLLPDGKREAFLLERKGQSVRGLVFGRFEILITEFKDSSEKVVSMRFSLRDLSKEDSTYVFSAGVRPQLGGGTEISTVGYSDGRGYVQIGVAKYDGRKNKLNSISDLMHLSGNKSQIAKKISCNGVGACSMTLKIKETSSTHSQTLKLKFTEKGSLALKEISKDPAMLFATHILELYQFYGLAVIPEDILP